MTTDTRARILEAALDTFCEKGYGACVDDIARRAGVVKQTLYHHYGSKDSLFREALTGLVNVLLVDLGARSGSLREDLLRFAESFQNQAMSEQGLALHRMLVAESPRFPELARAVFETWQLAGAELARLLREGMERGELRQDDPAFAADMLISLLTGTQRDLRLLGMPVECLQQSGRMVRIIDCFLRAYAPAGAPGS
ncbi:MAG: TetR/AcrR family transcriptional regulator [Curvibacter sp.]